MKPFLIDSWGTESNQLLRDLSAFVKGVIKQHNDVESPEEFEDRVNEWLGTNGPTYKRCRYKSVVMMVRPYKPLYLESRHCPCLRIFYEGQDGLGLFLIMAIGFQEIDTPPTRIWEYP